LVLIAIFSLRDPQLQAAISTDRLAVLVNKWLYFSYFSIAAITLFKMYDDYGANLFNHKIVFIFYLPIFLTFANTLVSALLEEVAGWREPAKPITAIGLMAVTYALSVVVLFFYLLLREAEPAMTHTPDQTPTRSTGRAPVIPSGGMREFAGALASHTKYWLIPIGVAMVLAALLVFGLPQDSRFSLYIFSTLGCMSLTIPIWQRIRP
jgi:hypothetical protein